MLRRIDSSRRRHLTLECLLSGTGLRHVDPGRNRGRPSRRPADRRQQRRRNRPAAQRLRLKASPTIFGIRSRAKTFRTRVKIHQGQSDQLVRDDGRIRLRQRGSRRLRAVRRRAGERHRSRNGSHRAPSRHHRRNSKAEILNILFGIASIFSPIIYDFGGLAEAGMMAKISREDELQADRYGLQLMSRAGYDPESMVTMMAHLGVLQDEHSDAVSKYLEDHPDPIGARRASHGLSGTRSQRRDAGADSWCKRPATKSARVTSSLAFGSTRFSRRIRSSSEALLELGQSELALGLTEQEPADAGRGGAAGFARDARRGDSTHRGAAPDGSAGGAR